MEEAVRIGLRAAPDGQGPLNTEVRFAGMLVRAGERERGLALLRAAHGRAQELFGDTHRMTRFAASTLADVESGALAPDGR